MAERFKKCLALGRWAHLTMETVRGCPGKSGEKFEVIYGIYKALVNRWSKRSLRAGPVRLK